VKRIAELEAEVEALKSSQQTSTEENLTLRSAAALKDQQITDLTLELDKSNSLSVKSESYIQKISELEMELMSRDQKISELSVEMESKEQQIVTLTEDMTRGRREIEELKKILQAHEEKISELSVEVESKEQQIVTLTAETAEKTTRIEELETRVVTPPQIPDPPPVSTSDLESELATRERVWSEEQAAKDQQIVMLSEECQKLQAQIAVLEAQTAAPAPSAVPVAASEDSVEEQQPEQEQEQKQGQEDENPSTAAAAAPPASLTVVSSVVPGPSSTSPTGVSDLEARIVALEQELLSRDERIQELTAATQAAPASSCPPTTQPTDVSLEPPHPPPESAATSTTSLTTEEVEAEAAANQSIALVNESTHQPNPTHLPDGTDTTPLPDGTDPMCHELILLRNQLKESELRSQEMLRDMADVILYLRKEVDGYHREAMEIQNDLYQSLVERQKEVDDEAANLKLHQLDLEQRVGTNPPGSWLSRFLGRR
jgi:DNA repair exonuclease SbcCD ATPase subunit